MTTEVATDSEAKDAPTSAAAASSPGRDERREHRRYQDRPLNIKIGKHKFPALDWSMGGFRFYPDGLELARKDKIDGQISGRRVKGSFSGEVVNVRDNGEVGIRFHNISRSLMSALGATLRLRRRPANHHACGICGSSWLPRRFSDSFS